jgi:hypothetical protein
MNEMKKGATKIANPRRMIKTSFGCYRALLILHQRSTSNHPRGAVMSNVHDDQQKSSKETYGFTHDVDEGQLINININKYQQQRPGLELALIDDGPY